MAKPGIVVNGTEVDFDGLISYEKAIEIAFGVYDSNIVYTVLYYAGKSDHVKGYLVKGQEPIKTHPGMVFNVTKTTQS